MGVLSVSGGPSPISGTVPATSKIFSRPIKKEKHYKGPNASDDDILVCLRMHILVDI